MRSKFKANGIEKAFGVHGGSIRAILLGRLKRSFGKRVRFNELSKLAGGPERAAPALRVLSEQGQRRQAPFRIVKEGIGRLATVTLGRR